MCTHAVSRSVARRRALRAATTALLAWCLAVATAQAEPRLLVGMSAPLTGPQASAGQELLRGLRAGLQQANAAAGGGRHIELLVRDDAGQPARALDNTRTLIDAGVQVLTGYHGAASAEAVLPLLEATGVPLVGVSSSAEVLREPARRMVFNLRAGAREEAAAMVLHLDTVGMTEVAVVAQDDALGRAALEGIQLELVRLALKPQAVVQLAPGAPGPAIAASVATACKSRPQAMVLATDAPHALALLRAARKAGCNPQWYVMSDAGAQLLADHGATGELAGVIVSQVLPHPASPAVPALIELRRLLPGAVPTYREVEGYLYARALAEVARRCGRDASRRCPVDALESRALELGGYRVQFAPGERRGSKFVDMTIVTADGRFRR